VAVVGVVPAAGYATRLGAIPCSKEVYPIGGRPVMEYLVERLRLAPCEAIRVVTRPEKADVIEHALRLGASVVLGRPATVADSLLLGVQGLADEDVALLGFPDSLWEPEDGFRSLLEELDGADVVLGCFRSQELERSDVVVVTSSGSVGSVHVKPESPPSDLVWGCAAARVEGLRGLRDHPEPGELFDRLAATGRVRAVVFDGDFVDVGTPEALERVRT
jgi:NDP-sugar pyrophosphorylase family protein